MDVVKHMNFSDNVEIKTYGELKNKSRKTAIVLSGGGATGSYQAGFLKAALEYNFKPEIVIGCSVGALNALGFIQDDMEFLEHLWTTINIESLIGRSNKKIDKSEYFNKEFWRYFRKWLFLKNSNNQKLYEQGKRIGLIPKGLEDIVYNNIDEEKIRKSNIEFIVHLTQVHQLGEGFTGWRPITLTKDEISVGLLADYVLGSSCFMPLFKAKKIGKGHFIDGGITNNNPWEKAIALGADEIINVNTGGKFLNTSRIIKTNRSKAKLLKTLDNVRFFTVRPPENIVLGAMDFFPELTKKMMIAGYETGLRFFEEYQKLSNL